MGLHTKAAGRTSIKVVVRTRDASAGQFGGELTELTDEVQILVSFAPHLQPPACILVFLQRAQNLMQGIVNLNLTFPLQILKAAYIISICIQYT